MTGRQVGCSMAERNEIQRAFDAFGKSEGMVKRSGSWYRTGDEVIGVMNLQKSQYGPRYYINVGYWLQAIEEAKFPPDEQCHILIRLDALIADRGEEVKALLDFDSEISGEERTQRLGDLLNSRLRPALEQGSSVDGLQKLRSEGLLKGAAIRGSAISILSEERDPPRPQGKQHRLVETPTAQMAIQASAVFLGASRVDSPMVVAVHRVRHLAREAGQRNTSDFGIEYLFHVGGPGHEPGYEGVRTGSFRKATGQKEIQIAVPALFEATPEEFLARSLEEGLALAELFFTRNHKGVSLSAARQATKEVIDQLRSERPPQGDL